MHMEESIATFNNCQLVVFKISGGYQCLRILEILSKHSEFVTVEFQENSSRCLIQMESRDLTDIAFNELNLEKFTVMKRSTITDNHWRLMSSKPCDNFEHEHEFYRKHFYLLHENPHPLDQELTTLLHLSVMSPLDITKRHKMLTELQEVLNFGIVHPFGSFMTRLGDPNSDVDVYFEDFEQGNKRKLLFQVEQAIIKARNNNGKFGSVIQTIPSARVPIVTFLHLETNIKCDISFINIMSVQNTKLIRFLTLLDPVVHPLLVLVKSWAHFHNLINRVGFKSYAIVLLVLVFLVKKKILPSVYTLQTYFNTQQVIVGGLWNVNFCDDLCQVQKAMAMLSCQPSNYNVNKPSLILPFLIEFFDLMITLDEQVMVCTLLGQFLPRELFLVGHRHKLPAELRQYFSLDSKKNRFQSKRKLSIQDPFELHYDVVSCCSENIYSRFIQAAKETRNRLSSSSETKLIDLFIPIKDERKMRRIQKIIQKKKRRIQTKYESTSSNTPDIIGQLPALEKNSQN